MCRAEILDTQEVYNEIESSYCRQRLTISGA